MNRREAIRAVMAMPALAGVYSAEVSPTDVIVVEIAEDLSDDHLARIHQQLQDVWPKRRIVMCGPSVRLKVVKESDIP